LRRIVRLRGIELWLGGLVGELLKSVVGVFSKRIVWKLGVLSAIVGGMALLTGSLMVAGHAAILELATAMPSGASLGLSLFMPTNTGACIGAMVSARLLRWAYDWQIKILTMKAVV
jgi:hypothetical protein